MKEIREALGKRDEIAAVENVESANSKQEQGTAFTVVEETARAASEKVRMCLTVCWRRN